MREDGNPNGCPCGRQHRPQERRRRTPSKPIAFDRLAERINNARYDGKAELDERRDHIWRVRYSGNCSNPIEMPVRTYQSHIMAVQLMRCRKCPGCLEAKRRYWGKLGETKVTETASQGRRTWFGTLTFSPEAQKEMEQRAVEAYMQAEKTSIVPDWFRDPLCDRRFELVRHEMVKELQKYWKRLRKAGHKFSYLAVFERHKSGLPHVHWMLHEETQAILKKDLANQWPHGFTNVKLVGGRSFQVEDAKKASWYVVKYLTKHVQSRQIASKKYGKLSHSLPSS